MTTRRLCSTPLQREPDDCFQFMFIVGFAQMGQPLLAAFQWHFGKSAAADSKRSGRDLLEQAAAVPIGKIQIHQKQVEYRLFQEDSRFFQPRGRRHLMTQRTEIAGERREQRLAVFDYEDTQAPAGAVPIRDFHRGRLTDVSQMNIGELPDLM